MTARQRGAGFVLCLLTIVLAVLDTQIVSAAAVPIVRDLDPAHGIDSIPWLVSAYALASAAMLPLYGKLCDLLGPKHVFLGALASFLLGSALCGAAQSMGQLIAARAVQGLGGGGLMSVTMVVLARLRGPGRGSGSRSAGFGGVVAGGGMALGPWLGGTLADHAGWRWIFYVNLPVGITVLVASALVLRLPGRPTRRPLDWAGSALAAAFAVSLLLVADWGGKTYAWSSPEIAGLLACTAGTLALFLWRQATAAEPVLPLSMFRVRALRWGFAVQGLLGASMTCVITYVLVYLQVVRGVSGSSAGLYLLPMAAGMTAVGVASGRLADRGWSARRFSVSGTLTTAVTLLLLATMDAGTPLWLVRGWLLLAGAGFGQLIGQLVQLVQDSAPRPQLGVATTSVRFFQTLGNALGTAVFGTLLTRLYVSDGGPGGGVSALGRLTGADRAHGLDAFVHAMDAVFLCGAAVMLLGTCLALRLPAGAPENTATAPDR